MHIYPYTEAELTQLANQVKELVIETLHAEGEIPGNPEQLSATYAVIAVRGTMLGRFWNKVRGMEKDEPRWTVLKSMDLKKE
jgi:hypothetical protein